MARKPFIAEDERITASVQAVLRTRRNELGVSRPELARRLGLADTNMAVYNMEIHGTGLRSIGRIDRVCRALGISTLEVLKEAGVR